MLHKYQKSILTYLIFLLPLTFVVGIAVTEIVALIIILSFLFKNRSLSFLNDKKFLFLLIFSLYIGIHAYLNINDNLKYSGIFYFRYLLLSLSIVFFLEIFENNKNKEIKNIFFLITFILAFIFFDTIFQFFNGENLFGNKIIRNRISGVFGSEHILGGFLVKLFPLYLWLIFYINFDLKKNFKYIILILSAFLICIYLTGERTSLALLLILLILLTVFVKKIRKIIFYSFTVLLIFIFITFFSNIGKSDLFNRIVIKTFNQLTNQVFIEENKQLPVNNIKKNPLKVIKNLKIFSLEHEGHYKLAYKLFLTEPLIGIGPRGFRYYCRSVEYDPDVGICSTHPHSIFFQILSETGILGIIFYMIGILFILRNLIKVYKIQNKNVDNDCFLISSIGIIIYLFPFLPSGNMFNNWISISNFYMFALYFYSYKRTFKL